MQLANNAYHKQRDDCFEHWQVRMQENDWATYCCDEERKSVLKRIVLFFCSMFQDYVECHMLLNKALKSYQEPKLIILDITALDDWVRTNKCEWKGCKNIEQVHQDLHCHESRFRMLSMLWIIVLGEWVIDACRALENLDTVGNDNQNVIEAQIWLRGEKGALSYQSICELLVAEAANIDADANHQNW